MTLPLWYGVLFKDGDVTPSVQPDAPGRDEALRFIARVDDADDPGELVVSVRSGWMAEEHAEKLRGTMPLTECRVCKSANLGFEVTIMRSTSGTSTPQFYQGCNSCSETLWVGDWDLFCAVLGLAYGMRIPRCE
jgi:hypothetical protein